MIAIATPATITTFTKQISHMSITFCQADLNRKLRWLSFLLLYCSLKYAIYLHIYVLGTIHNNAWNFDWPFRITMKKNTWLYVWIYVYAYRVLVVGVLDETGFVVQFILLQKLASSILEFFLGLTPVFAVNWQNQVWTCCHYSLQVTRHFKTQCIVFRVIPVRKKMVTTGSFINL